MTVHKANILRSRPNRRIGDAASDTASITPTGLKVGMQLSNQGTTPIDIYEFTVNNIQDALSGTATGIVTYHVLATVQPGQYLGKVEKLFNGEDGDYILLSGVDEPW